MYTGSAGTSRAPSPTTGFDHAFVGAAALGGPLGHRQNLGHFPAGASPRPTANDGVCAGKRIHPFRGVYCGMHKCIPYGVGAMARKAWWCMRICMGAAVDVYRFRRDVEGAVPYDGVRSCIRRGRRPRRPVVGYRQNLGHFPGSKPRPTGKRWRVRFWWGVCVFA